MNPTQAASRISAVLEPQKAAQPQKNKPSLAQRPAASSQQQGTRKGQPAPETAAEDVAADDAIAPHGENGADDLLNADGHSEQEHGQQDGETDPLALNDEGEHEAGDTGASEEETQTHTVKVDGKELQVSTAELIKGYERQSDYTKKSTALAHERKQVETMKEEVKDLPQVKKAYQESTQEFARNSQLVLKALQDRFLPKAPDPSLAKTDPGSYIEKKELHQEALQFIGGIKQELGKAAEIQNGEFQKLKAESRGKLVTLIPEIADVAHRTKFTSYLTELGFTTQDIANTVDNRLFQMAHKAWKYDEMMKAKKNVSPEQQRPKVVKNGISPEDPKAAQARQKREPFNTHKRERSVDSAARALANIL